MLRWLIPLIGIIAVSILVWFGGPMVAINDAKPFASITNRILLILIVIVLWALNYLWKQLKEKKANEQLMSGIAEGEQQPAARKNQPAPTVKESEDAAVIRKNFQEAISALKKTKLKGRHGEQHLYELPWYIIIGPPGAGKTTALANSGLRFPLGDRFGQLALRGIGGTRDCDWWFTDEAILIDTAGRYTTQDSNVEIDSGGWNSFLSQLKKYRARRPINGVFIAISLSELLLQSDNERAKHANAIKHRIHELNQKLGINTPVYVLFTKCDLIAGFMEFFDDLGREDRAQIWGCTFPLDSPENPQGVVHQFAQEFDTLLQRLNGRVMSRLHQERDPQRRSLIHAFPYQMGGLKDIADKFLKDIFTPSRFEDRFILRGVYFTSGTQEGTPIDRMMSSLASTFGLDRQSAPSYSGQGRSYFITHLFHDVIFRESNLVGTNRKFERRVQWIQRGAFAASLLTIIGAVIAWTTSYNGNASYIKAADKKIDLFQQENSKLTKYSDAVKALPALAALRQAKDIYTDQSISAFTGLGLNQENNINESGEKAYQAVINTVFLPLVRSRLEQQLSSGSNNPDFLLSALKVYLMLGNPDRRDPEFINLWLSLDSQNALTGDTEGQQELKGTLAYLAKDQYPAQPQNKSVIKLARTSLSKIPTDQLVYSRLKQEAQTSQIPDFLLAKELGINAEGVFETRKKSRSVNLIPSLYTYNGFKDFYLKNGLRLAKESTEENWVMGDKAKQSMTTDPKTLNREVRKHYVHDYINYWNTLLNSLAITRFNSLDQAVRVLDSLSGPNSPLRILLQAVDKNTDLDKESKGLGALKEAAGQKLEQSQRLSQAMSHSSGLMKKSEPPGAEVAKEFKYINKLVASNKGAPTELDAILKSLSEVHAYLVEIASSPDGRAAFQAAAKKMDGQPDALSRLRVKAFGQRGPIKDWLNDVADNSWQIILGNARGFINNAWQTEVYDSYNNSLNGMYPLYKGSSKEATLGDFAKFFAPNGTIDTFFKKYLKHFVTTGRRRWHLRVVDNHSIGISRSNLIALQHASNIKDTFFPRGSEKPRLDFSLRPVDLDAQVYKFTLDLEDQRIVYRHGPARSTKLQWPGPSGATTTKMTFETTGNNIVSKPFTGDWSWFRALDYSRIKPGRQRDNLHITFALSNLKAKFVLRASSVNNPFTTNMLSTFRCPKRL